MMSIVLVITSGRKVIYFKEPLWHNIDNNDIILMQRNHAISYTYSHSSILYGLF
jgi:hypothetical protein